MINDSREVIPYGRAFRHRTEIVVDGRVIDLADVKVRVERVHLADHRRHSTLMDEEISVPLDGSDAHRNPAKCAV